MAAKKRRKSFWDWLFGMGAGICLIGAAGIAAMAGASTLLGFLGSSAVIGTVGGGAAFMTASGVLSSAVSFLTAPLIGTMSLLSGLPLIGPVFMSAGLAFPPIGIAVAALISFPVILGASYEALKTWLEFAKLGYDPANPGASILSCLFRGIVGLIGIPFNFVSGFCRTASNMVTGSGYSGSFRETRDAVRENAAHQTQSSLLGPIFSPVWDRILIGPVTGLLMGGVGSLQMLGRACLNIFSTHPLVTLRNIGIAIVAPLIGFVRGFKGSYVGFDTREHLVTNYSYTQLEKDDRIADLEDKVEKVHRPVPGAPPAFPIIGTYPEIAQKLGNTDMFGKETRYTMTSEAGKAGVNSSEANRLLQEAHELRTKKGISRKVQHPANSRAKVKEMRAQELSRDTQGKQEIMVEMVALGRGKKP